MATATLPAEDDLPAALRFLAGGGAATRRILARDWTAHPMGPPERWPEAFKVALSAVLNSPESMFVAWGADDLWFFFNDTYTPLLGPRADWAMGERFREVWADGWAQAEPIVRDAFAGDSRRFVDLPWRLGTDRGAAETWFTFSYSRVLAADGSIAGLLVVTNETTDRVLADRRRVDAEEQLERAQSGGGIGLFSLDAAGVVRATPSFCRLYGLPPAEAIASATFEALVLPDDRHLVADRTQRAAGVITPDAEYRIRRADDGAVRWIARQGEVEYDADGRFVRFAGVSRDITEQVEAREALARQQGAQAVLLQLGDRLREARTVSAVTDAATALLGRALGATVVGYGAVAEDGNTVRVERDWTSGIAAFSGEIRFADYGAAVDALRRGETLVVRDVTTDPLIGRPGERGMHAVVVVPVFEGGRFRALLYVGMAVPFEWTDEDVALIVAVADRIRTAAERARSEEDVRRHADELARINASLEAEVTQRTADRNRLWQLSDDMMVLTDLDGRIEAVNPAWTRVLGWAEDELIGRPLFDFLHPDAVAPAVGAIAAIGRGESFARFANRYRHKDGSYRDLSWTAGPGDGKIIGVGRDETLERARAARLAAAEDQLRQAQKMEAVGQLTGGIAHDFNNMLTGVIGSMDLLKRHLGPGQSERASRYIDAATTSAQRAAALTQRLLAFSRRQSLDIRPVDLNALVVGLEELLARTLGENIGLELSLATEAFHARTDANQLESALLNLAINARDAMPDGGRLTIATGNLHVDADHPMATEELSPGDYATVRVADTGTGMSAEVIAKAFDPFFTTKPIGAGTGLGLSMIWGFAKQSDGHVRIDSTPGEGTAVTLYLPRAQAAAATDAAGDGPRPAGAGESVLLVEDDPAVRMLVADVLRDLGYRVEQAGDAREALPKLAAMDRVDLLITDVGLPGMSGRELADRAREGLPELKVLFVTGYAEGAAHRAGFLAPGMDMVTKPFAIDLLSAKIRAMLE
jgi:PAS domain S-box-containing protein